MSGFYLYNKVSLRYCRVLLGNDERVEPTYVDVPDFLRKLYTLETEHGKWAARFACRYNHLSLLDADTVHANIAVDEALGIPF